MARKHLLQYPVTARLLADRHVPLHLYHIVTSACSLPSRQASSDEACGACRARERKCSRTAVAAEACRFHFANQLRAVLGPAFTRAHLIAKAPRRTRQRGSGHRASPPAQLYQWPAFCKCGFETSPAWCTLDQVLPLKSLPLPNTVTAATSLACIAPHLRHKPLQFAASNRLQASAQVWQHSEEQSARRSQR